MNFQNAPSNIVEMEVEVSLVDDDSYSREVFKCSSIQRQMGFKVQKTNV
jgi:hypothetical protein